MQLQEHKKVYVSDNEIFSFQDTLLDNISFKVFVVCYKDKFLQYQKDIFEEFVADFTNVIKTSEELDIEDIRQIFTDHLELLNTKLKQFAEKVRDVEHFQLKWVIQLVVDDKLMSSMIGNVSMMVMRDQKTTYSISNTIDNRSKIDLCSDFIEWEIERDDQILYIWLKFADVMDAHDIREMENLLSQEETSEGILSFVEDLFLTRIEKSSIWFILSYFVQWPTIRPIKGGRGKSWLKLKWMSWIKWKSLEYASVLWDKVQNSETVQKLKKQLMENKMYFVWIILVVLILIFLYALISQIINSSKNTNKFETAPWVYEVVNLEDIQADIEEFKSLDASSTLKTTKYNDITARLDFLESQWKWLEDVEWLRNSLKEDYYDWFNIKQIKTQDDLDSRSSRILTFNSTEIDKLWELHSIVVPRNMMIAWSKWAMIDASSDASKWHLQSYDLTKPLQDCISALNSNWLYCYNGSWEIYMISKSWIVPVQTDDWNFRSWIGWLWTFGSKNLYVFQSNVSSLWNMLLTRYQTSDGTYANFKWGASYSIAASGVDFGTFSSFAIDGNFFGWADGNLYLFWREDLAWTTLNYRKIDIKGWNPLTDSYSDHVKVITNKDTRYIYTYDRDQKLFTVYNTEKNKMNEVNKKWYQLVYLFSLKFDMEWVDVYDVDVSSVSGDRPELYILTSQWVNKIALYEYIETMN